MTHPLAHARRSRLRDSLHAVAVVLLLLFVFDAAPPLAQTQGGTDKPAAQPKPRKRAVRRRTRRKPSYNTSTGKPKPPDANTATTNPQPPPPAEPPGASFGERPKPRIVSGGVLNGKALSKPEPIYPEVAKSAMVQGTVTVQIVVDEEGKVISASAVSGHPLLQQAAVKAARLARFAPTLLSGQPVKVSGVLTYKFVLRDGSIATANRDRKRRSV